MRGWLAVAFGFAMLALPAMAEQQESEKSKAIASLETGDYIYRGYVENLAHTLSPLASLEIGSRPQVVAVRRKGDAISLTAEFNWHEGCGLITAHESATGSAALEYGDCGRSIDVSVESSRGFVLDGNHYDFVGNAGHYIGAAVLGGVYADDDGRRFLFGSDGQAVFPEKKFSFELCLEQVVPPCSGYDSFDDKTNNMSYVFRRHADSLVLYKAPKGEFDPADYAQPLVTLHRIQEK